MDLKDRILEAAASLYSRHGFRGATTRLIAQEAGVNEVTLFRTFGSKETLIAEAIRHRAHLGNIATLPDDPVDPERELAAWCRTHLHQLRDARAMIRTCMGELEDRPELSPGACSGPIYAAEQLSTYLERLKQLDLVDAALDVRAAVAMFLGASFADAMGRDMMPDMFPSPEERAADEYTRLFARAIGLRVAATPDGQADGDPGTPSFNATSP